MKEGIKYTGIPSVEELSHSPGCPSQGRMERGAVACLECVQDIPCNPCEKACPFGAITIGQPITNLPRLDENKCTGCGICVAQCPGLAIFVIHKNYSEKTAWVQFPYEYDPLPAVGEEVPCGDRAGKFVAKGKVLKVKLLKSYDRTPVITVEIPKKYYMKIRTICREASR
jgi:Fe-S-cluster-containing hydrogenase component 2